MLEINRIYCENCLEGMKRIDDESIDMILTDPPYGINLTPQRMTSKFKNIKIKQDDNLEWLDEFVDICHKILKNDGVIYCFCNWEKYDIFKQKFQRKFIII